MSRTLTVQSVGTVTGSRSKVHLLRGMYIKGDKSEQFAVTYCAEILHSTNGYPSAPVRYIVKEVEEELYRYIKSKWGKHRQQIGGITCSPCNSIRYMLDGALDITDDIIVEKSTSGNSNSRTRKVKTPKKPVPQFFAAERREWVQAANRVWVDCVGCGGPIRGISIICTDCRYKPHTPTA